MQPVAYQREGITLHLGDSLAILPTLPDSSVQCCVTSPPYWGLRDYGTAEWVGGDSECDHKKTTLVTPSSTLRNDGRIHKGPYPGEKATTFSVTPFRDKCGKCGAVRVDAQLGLESSPDEYVSKMVAVFREVRRVLKDDGTLWMNLGDSYATGTSSPSRPSKNTDVGYWQQADSIGRSRIDGREFGLKPKDLVGIPWRVAFALQADGWYLRQDIIWHKPNPMPESVRDRCTKAHEYIFLLSKSERYYFDADAIAEPSSGLSGGASFGKQKHSTDGTKAQSRTYERPVYETRNRRSVWTVTTKPFKGAHFATFPPDLIEPCILAGCPKGGVVLDPFIGAGTTALVAHRNSRKCIGIELNPKYLSEITIPRLDAECEKTALFAS